MQASAFAMSLRALQHEDALGLVVMGGGGVAARLQDQVQLLLLHRRVSNFRREYLSADSFSKSIGIPPHLFDRADCQRVEKVFSPRVEQEYTVDPAGFRALCTRKPGAFLETGSLFPPRASPVSPSWVSRAHSSFPSRRIYHFIVSI